MDQAGQGFTGLPPLFLRAPSWPVDLLGDYEVEEGAPPRGFLIRVEGESLALDGLILRRSNRLILYRNQCRHWPVLMDFGDGDFLGADERTIQCRHHGALYDAETGLCFAGPCVGSKLLPIPFCVEAGRIFVLRPEDQSFDLG